MTDRVVKVSHIVTLDEEELVKGGAPSGGLMVDCATQVTLDQLPALRLLPPVELGRASRTVVDLKSKEPLPRGTRLEVRVLGDAGAAQPYVWCAGTATGKSKVDGGRKVDGVVWDDEAFDGDAGWAYIDLAHAARVWRPLDEPLALDKAARLDSVPVVPVVHVVPVVPVAPVTCVESVALVAPVASSEVRGVAAAHKVQTAQQSDARPSAHTRACVAARAELPREASAAVKPVQGVPAQTVVDVTATVAPVGGIARR